MGFEFKELFVLCEGLWFCLARAECKWHIGTGSTYTYVTLHLLVQC